MDSLTNADKYVHTNKQLYADSHNKCYWYHNCDNE